MTEMGKRFVLLSAYEELTEKETFCIKEANFDEIRKVQAKKSRLLEELGSLDDEDRLKSEQRVDFNRRIDRLQTIEQENESRLEALMDQNRSEIKTLSKRSSSASKIKKAYGTASSPDNSSGSLKNKA